MISGIIKRQITDSMEEYAKLLVEETPDELEQSESHIRVAKVIDQLVDGAYKSSAWWQE